MICVRCSVNEGTCNKGCWCSSCQREYNKIWRAKNPDKRNRAAYTRQRYLGVNGPNGTRYILAPGKRPWTGVCEMCGSKPKRTVYHHWNNANFAQGMWICQPCHNMAHTIEKGLHTRYLNVKHEINELHA